MFVFYDTETTGLDENFSQILQIALVFTDGDLNILSSKKLECRSSPWVVPSPGALLTTGFVPGDLKFSKLSNYEMIREVNDWLGGQHWPLTFIGYNSIRYDEQILAQNLYQNLLDPKLTSSKNDTNNQFNGRADILSLVKVVSVYMPGVLKLDIKNHFGDPSTTLENVAQQNGVTLSPKEAHDAMNDIRATVGVAKLLHKAAPQIWDQMMKLSTKAGVDAFLAAHPVFTHMNTTMLHDHNGKLLVGMTPSVMTSLAERDGSATQALFDLSIDPAPYLNMTVDQLKEVFLLKEKDRPFKLIRKEAQPVLMPLDVSEHVLPAGYDEKLYAARAKTLQSDKSFLDRVAKAALLAKQAKPDPAPLPLPETQIHNGITPAIGKRLDQWAGEFHAAEDWISAVKLVDDFHVRFKAEIAADPSLTRFAELAERIIFEHAPHEFSEEKQKALKKHVASRILDAAPDAPYMTVAKARLELKKIEEKREKGDKQWAHVTDKQIRSLKLYYTALEKEYAAFAPAQPVNDNAPEAPPAKKSFNGHTGPKP